ncbi:UNVERIFIED_ORG: hypothetical protein ABRZ91_000920 [Heyndrickxia coagulans]|jgi:hypothetical protein
MDEKGEVSGNGTVIMFRFLKGENFHGKDSIPDG